MLSPLFGLSLVSGATKKPRKAADTALGGYEVPCTLTANPQNIHYDVCFWVFRCTSGTLGLNPMKIRKLVEVVAPVVAPCPLLNHNEGLRRAIGACADENADSAGDGATVVAEALGHELRRGVGSTVGPLEGAEQGIDLSGDNREATGIDRNLVGGARSEPYMSVPSTVPGERP